MFYFPLPDSDKPAEILLLGAHCDDIEIGCYGVIANLLSKSAVSRIRWIVFSSGSVRENEARESANALVDNRCDTQIDVLNFRNGHFPAIVSDIKDYFETLKAEVNPDLIFTHYLSDRHQDHRTIAELTWNTFRNHTILEYEIPKYDGDLGNPGVFVPLNENTVTNKGIHLLQYFESQRSRSWFTQSTFESILRIRGIECNAESGFAEAFYARKLRFR